MGRKKDDISLYLDNLQRLGTQLRKLRRERGELREQIEAAFRTQSEAIDKQIAELEAQILGGAGGRKAKRSDLIEAAAPAKPPAARRDARSLPPGVAGVGGLRKAGGGRMGAIAALLEKLGQPITVTDMCKSLGYPLDQTTRKLVASACSTLTKNGTIKRLEKGLYAIASYKPSKSDSGTGVRSAVSPAETATLAKLTAEALLVASRPRYIDEIQRYLKLDPSRRNSLISALAKLTLNGTIMRLDRGLFVHSACRPTAKRLEEAAAAEGLKLSVAKLEANGIKVREAEEARADASARREALSAAQA